MYRSERHYGLDVQPAPVRYQPRAPRDPLWLPGQGWLVAFLACLDGGLIAFFIFKLITRTLLA